MLELTNPRTTAVIDDWPHGFHATVTATFTLEITKNGQRVARQTSSEKRPPSKPKKTTYHLRMCIVDGSDGKTYLLGHTEYGQMVLVPGTLKTTEYFHHDSHDAEEAATYTAYHAILYGDYE
jgi:hypothetical protein